MDLSYFPGAKTKRSDWQVAVVATGVLADFGAARAGLFSFRNGDPDPAYGGMEYDMLFIGGGLGVDIGARISGKEALKLKDNELLGKKWHKINCDRPFSAMDLDRSLGRVTSLTLGVYDIALISAGNLSGSLFGGQSVSGLSLGLGGAVTIGGWVYAF